MMTRRRFLTSSALAGMSFLDLAIRAAKDDYRGFPMGIQSWTLRSYSAEKAIEIIKDLGLGYVEFYQKHAHPNHPEKVSDHLRKLLKKSGIRFNAFGVQEFTKDHEKNRGFFEFAKLWGLDSLSATPRMDSFDSLEKLVDEYGIRIAIHNHGPRDRFDKISDVEKAVKGRHKFIGACVDTGHFLRSKEDPIDAIHRLKGRVFGIHLKDVEKKQGNTPNVILGEGHLDITGIFQALKETDFPANGVLSLEYEAHSKAPVKYIKECLKVVKKALKKF